MREVLETHEKDQRKQLSKKMNGYRAHRDKLLIQAAKAKEGSGKRRGLEAQATRRDRQIQVLKIQAGMAEAEEERRQRWRMGKDAKDMHDALRGGQKIAARSEVLSMAHPTQGKVTGQKEILGVFEEHLKSVFDLDSVDKGGGAARKRAPVPVIGMKVRGKFGSWFTGTIRDVHVTGNFDVEYEDGDVEENIGWSSVLIPARQSLDSRNSTSDQVNAAQPPSGPATPKRANSNRAPVTRRNPTPASSSQKDFTQEAELGRGRHMEALVPVVGMRVRGKFGTWFEGTIKNIHNAGSFDVEYDDGDIERQVRWSSVLMPIRLLPGEVPGLVQGSQASPSQVVSSQMNSGQTPVCGGSQEQNRQETKEKLLNKIRRHVELKDKEEIEQTMGGLCLSEILSGENIRAAIAEIKKGTVPGEDGFDTNFYNKEEVTDALIGHLRELFHEVVENKIMTKSMREARMSMLHKGRGKSEDLPKNYRPVAVTATTYRILMKAVQLKLAPAATAVMGDTQVGYMTDGRRIWDNTILLSEMARQLDKPGTGGVAIQVDNTAAFDRVRWDFMHDVLEAMGFPKEFRDFMRIVYTDLQYKVSVNGRLGEAHRAYNGVRQGCPASPLMFALVQEALLVAIRDDRELKGVGIVAAGGNIKEVRERCLADDTVVYLQDMSQAPRLFSVIGEYVLASGQLLNPGKSMGILFGDEKGKEPRDNMGIRWVNFGEEDVDEGLGIIVGTDEQLQDQWSTHAKEVMKEMRGRMSQSRDEWGTSARVRIIQGAYVSRLTYRMQVQAPTTADEVMAHTQADMDAALFEGTGGRRGWYFIPKTLATQPEEDGGLGHTDFECRLEAAWADLVLSLAGRQEIWKEMWIRELEEVYGGLDCKDMGHTTCGFHKYMRDGRGSEILRRGLAALAKLPPPEGRVEIREQEAAGEEEGEDETEKGAREGRDGQGKEKRAKDTAKEVKYGGVSDKSWTREEVEEQRLFFNPWYIQGTRLTGRSTLEIEIEATKWSRVGLRKWRDLVRERAPLKKEVFVKCYPGLDLAVYEEMLREFPSEINGRKGW